MSKDRRSPREQNDSYLSGLWKAAAVSLAFGLLALLVTLPAAGSPAALIMAVVLSSVGAQRAELAVELLSRIEWQEEPPITRAAAELTEALVHYGHREWPEGWARARHAAALGVVDERFPGATLLYRVPDEDESP